MTLYTMLKMPWYIRATMRKLDFMYCFCECKRSASFKHQTYSDNYSNWFNQLMIAMHWNWVTLTNWMPFFGT